MRAEAQSEPRSRHHRRRQPVGSTDDEINVMTLIAPATQAAREIFRRPGIAMFVEANANRLRKPRQETSALPVRSASRLNLYFLQPLDSKRLADLASARQIVVQEGPFRTLLESADTKKTDFQETSV